MVRVFRASLDLRDDIHCRLTANDLPNLRRSLTRWCDTAPSNTSRLPRFLVFPLQPCGSSEKLCQEILRPAALGRVQALLGLAAELDILCYLAEVKTTISTVAPTNPLKDDSEPAKLLRLECMDGSVAEDAVEGAEFAQSFFVPADVYTKRTASVPKEQQKPGFVCKFTDLVLVQPPEQHHLIYRATFTDSGIGSGRNAAAATV